MTIDSDIHGVLIANADDVANSFIEKWGRAVVGEPQYSEEHGWHVEVIGVLGDIQMDTVRVLSTGAREMVA